MNTRLGLVRSLSGPQDCGHAISYKLGRITEKGEGKSEGRRYCAGSLSLPGKRVRQRVDEEGGFFFGARYPAHAATGEAGGGYQGPAYIHAMHYVR